jgi:imidazolonepropionase-like amidohydrolase
MSLVLRNGVALAGEGLVENPFAALAIEDGRIASIGPAAGGDPAIDLDGAYVLPGLIDAHVHFDLIASVNAYARWDAPAAVRAIGLLRNGLIALAHGITTIRDLGCVDTAVLDYGRLTAAGHVVGPRVVAAGRWIVMTGGHGWEHGREADGPDEVRRAVREQVRVRAGVIKLMATGGLSTPGSADAVELGPDELRAGVIEAHNAGLKVSAHAHAARGIENAIHAGVDSIEHGAFADERCLELLRQHDVALVPTLVALEHVRPGSGIDAEVVAKSEAARAPYRATIGRAMAAGVRIVAGTDAGTALNPIGLLAEELALYHRLGMTTTDAIRSATVAGGRLLGGGVGIVAEGAPADLAIFDRDPREDLDVLRRPRLVISRGVPIDVDWARRTIAALGAEEADRLLDLGTADPQEGMMLR